MWNKLQRKNVAPHGHKKLNWKIHSKISLESPPSYKYHKRFRNAIYGGGLSGSHGSGEGSRCPANFHY